MDIVELLAGILLIGVAAWLYYVVPRAGAQDRDLYMADEIHQASEAVILGYEWIDNREWKTQTRKVLLAVHAEGRGVGLTRLVPIGDKYKLGETGILQEGDRIEVHDKSFPTTKRRYRPGGTGQSVSFDYIENDIAGAEIIVLRATGHIIPLVDFPLRNGKSAAANAAATARRAIEKLNPMIVARDRDPHDRDCGSISPSQQEGFDL